MGVTKWEEKLESSKEGKIAISPSLQAPLSWHLLPLPSTYLPHQDDDFIDEGKRKLGGENE